MVHGIIHINQHAFTMFTGISLIENRTLQITKGATFRYVYGTCSAVWRSFREAGWYLLHKGANPFPILFNMLKGIWILR